MAKKTKTYRLAETTLAQIAELRNTTVDIGGVTLAAYDSDADVIEHAISQHYAAVKAAERLKNGK